MAGNIWDDKISNDTKWGVNIGATEKNALSPYGNIVALFKETPYTPHEGKNAADDVGDKLSGLLSPNHVTIDDGFATPLNNALADSALRSRIAALTQSDPAKLSKALDDVSGLRDRDGKAMHDTLVRELMPTPSGPAQTAFNKAAPTPATAPSTAVATATPIQPSQSSAQPSKPSAAAPTSSQAPATQQPSNASSGDPVADKLMQMLSDPENADLAAAVGRLNEGQQKILFDTFKKKLKDDPNLIDEIKDLRKQCPNIFKSMLNQMGNTSGDDSDFKKTLENNFSELGNLKKFTDLKGIVLLFTGLIDMLSGGKLHLTQMVNNAMDSVMAMPGASKLVGMLGNSFKDSSSGDQKPAPQQPQAQAPGNSALLQAQNNLQDGQEIHGNADGTFTVKKTAAQPTVS